MKDEKDILLDDFFKDAAELQIEDNGFTESVINALPNTQALSDRAIVRLRRKVRLLEASCITAGIALFFFLKGWNMAYDLLASVFAMAMSINIKHLLINTVPLMLLIPTIAAATAIYFLGKPELSKRW
ncbi:MAG: DUF5056 domain-containing protein [Prevotella sp.]